jgi:hypothetical protein
MHTIEWRFKKAAIAFIAGMTFEVIAPPLGGIVWNFSKSAPCLEHSCLQRDL